MGKAVTDIWRLLGSPSTVPSQRSRSHGPGVGSRPPVGGARTPPLGLRCAGGRLAAALARRHAGGDPGADRGRAPRHAVPRLPRRRRPPGDRRPRRPASASRSAVASPTTSRWPGTRRCRACMRTLERLGDDWLLADDGLSRNGTYVNGERVDGRRSAARRRRRRGRRHAHRLPAPLRGIGVRANGDGARIARRAASHARAAARAGRALPAVRCDDLRRARPPTGRSPTSSSSASTP